MDIMLERILSLIPKKPDGKYVHGAKADFARNIGAPSNIFAEWCGGRNKSYTNYVYQIADMCGVSVAWLKGETDDRSIKKKPVQSLDELLPGYSDLDDDRKAKVREYIALLYKDQCSE